MLPPLQPLMALHTMLADLGPTLAPIYKLGRHTTVGSLAAGLDRSLVALLTWPMHSTYIQVFGKTTPLALPSKTGLHILTHFPSAVPQPQFVPASYLYELDFVNDRDLPVDLPDGM